MAKKEEIEKFRKFAEGAESALEIYKQEFQGCEELIESAKNGCDNLVLALSIIKKQEEIINMVKGRLENDEYFNYQFVKDDLTKINKLLEE